METQLAGAIRKDQWLGMLDDSSLATIENLPSEPIYTIAPDSVEAIFTDDESDTDEASESDDFAHIAAGAITSTIFLILLVCLLLWFRRRRQRRLAAKMPSIEELELRRLASNNNSNSNGTAGTITNLNGSQDRNHNNYTSASPQIQVPVPVPTRSARATSIPPPINPPITPTRRPARESMRPYVLPGSNATYFTGTGIGIDTSDRASIADTLVPYNSISRPVAGAGLPTDINTHEEEEPPPPYQPRDVPNG